MHTYLPYRTFCLIGISHFGPTTPTFIYPNKTLLASSTSAALSELVATNGSNPIAWRPRRVVTSCGVARPENFDSPSPPGKSGAGRPWTKLIRWSRRYAALVYDVKYHTYRREQTTPHFLTERGAAGIYNTDESAFPLCSPSTACTVSQCQ